MLFDEYSFDDDTNTVYKDMITLILLGIVTLFIIVLFHINPVGTKNDGEIKQPGSMSIELAWPNESKMDLDLWVKAPDEIPVSYQNTSTEVLNLVRDDLGVTSDLIQFNFENVFSRGAPPGEYIVNIHVYNANSEPFPIKAVIKVRIINLDNPAGTEQVLIKEVTLTENKQELTVFRFTLDNNVLIVPGSINDIPFNLVGRVTP